jgi:UDP-glucuronate 4-epimerase
VKKVLVTGAAGFIGHAVACRLLTEGWRVVGIDNLNDYYDVRLKKARLADLKSHAKSKSFSFQKLDLTDRAALMRLVKKARPQVVIHLAAQAGVRYGLENPPAYLESNLIGHFNLLEAVRQAGGIRHLLYASSSSVYGSRKDAPFREGDDVSQPVSLYAATKAADELLTHAWSAQFGLAATALRFFTVYGPWGRPDMSPMLFAAAILEGRVIPLFNGGDLWRDFTYVDDVVEAVMRLVGQAPKGKIPYAVFNLGNQKPVRMTDFVTALGQVLGKKPRIARKPWPATEVYQTCADTTRLKKAIAWQPAMPLKKGLEQFAQWYIPWHASQR